MEIILSEVLDAIEEGIYVLSPSGDALYVNSAVVDLYGMSKELGLMAPASIQNEYLEGQSYLDCSQETASVIDKEVKQLLANCYEDAKRILTENRALLDEISEYLLNRETITGDELMAFVNAEEKSSTAEDTTADDTDFAE